MFFLWTLLIFTAGYVVLMPTVLITSAGILNLVEFLPDESLMLLGLDTSSGAGDGASLIGLVYFILLLVWYLGFIGGLTETITLIKSQVRSILTTLVPFTNRKGVGKIKSKISWVKFLFPFKALWRTIISGGVLLSLICFSVTTFFSGHYLLCLIYAVVAYIYFHIIGQVINKGTALGFDIHQFATDMQAIARNYAMAKAEEEKIAFYNRALTGKQQKHQERLAKEHHRDLARKRDMDRRRSERRKSFAAGLGAFISSVKDLF